MGWNSSGSSDSLGFLSSDNRYVSNIKQRVLLKVGNAGKSQVKRQY